MAGILRAYTEVLRKRPILVQSLQAGTLMGLGDITSQLWVERRSWDDMDWLRPARFFMLGSCVGGPITSRWYQFLNLRYGASRTPRTLVRKIALDQLVYGPCFLTLVLTLNEGVLKGGGVQGVSRMLREDLRDIVLTGWSVFPLLQTVNFSLVAPQYQVLVLQVAVYFWNVYLAWKVNRSKALN